MMDAYLFMKLADGGYSDMNILERKKDYDAIVVGSGITGGWAAKELTEKGLTVLVIERGSLVEHGNYQGEHKAPYDYPDRMYKKDVVYGERYELQSQCYAFSSATKQFFVEDAKYKYEWDEGKPFMWIRGYHLGGRSLTWGRQCYRWSDLDFEANLQDGFGIDWPIRYADIAPWYSYVERFVGVSGSKEGISVVPDGEFLPPMDLNCAERKVKSGIERAYPDRRLIIGRAAVLTEALNGRAPCHYCGPCHRGCSTGSYFSSLSATLPAATATGKLTIITDSIVESVGYDESSNRATGVRVVDALTKESTEYRSDLVFLCASTLGSTQIMLNSTSTRFPNGLANDSGALGHYLMDHPYGAGASGEVEGLDDEFFIGRRPNGIYIPRFQNLSEETHRTNYLRGYGCQGGAYREGWGRSISQEGIGEDLKVGNREPGKWRFGAGGWGEMLPRYENRVYLDPAKKDEWGIPILRVDCEFSDNEINMVASMAEEIAEMLEAAGVKNVSSYNSNVAPGFCIHEMGTARMGHNPAESVLNSHNQAHAVPNLFVTDGSCMTSSACQNPSITYMALTARACDYAVDQLKRREI